MNRKQRIEQERFHRMAIRVAAFLTDTDPVERYENIPEKLRFHFETLSYCELIRPLVHYDRFEKKVSIPRISITYGITIQQVKTALSKKPVNI